MSDHNSNSERELDSSEWSDVTEMGVSGVEPPFEPATILVTVCPAVGQEKEWERALSELVRASFPFPGHLGTTVLKPATAGDRRYRIITKFDSIQHMENWRDSDERQRRVEEILRFQSKPADIHYVTGLETWFELPHHEEAVLQPPPKYKMAVLIWIAVYCTVLPLIAALKPVFSPLPQFLSSAFLAVASVALMTWVVMPLLTLLFRSWLYPTSLRTKSAIAEDRSKMVSKHGEHIQPQDRQN